MTRIIKKYKNRRLYDVANAKYINVSDLVSLIQVGETVEVLDATSGESITNSVLLQALIESGGAVRLPSNLLHIMIRLQIDSPIQALMVQQLQTSMSLLGMQLESLERNNPWRQQPARSSEDVEALRERLAMLEEKYSSQE